MNAPEQVRGHSGAADEPVFQEPWEAQAFALAVALSERGIFTWAEWTQTLGATIQAATKPQDSDGSAYYQCWLKALEQLVAEKQLVAATTLATRKEAWRRAAHATPHGSPILLENDPLARS
ncbi:nitrile hydratase accessory protein [Methylocapsa sp. S129]|uniref:nitrile hydratase accessory protein n=1 Tax=Methylocapsa sp. S129 TaxID=1641869 RepID=UPI00131AFC19|nr:nitrile hydratase accessory protein [Methylocapsa sp. S129]